jgi:KRAB domain-containing zinc finger protein
MSGKITNFFKILPKSIKTEAKDSIIPEIRECQVILKDIKHQFGNDELKLFNEISLNENCKSGKHICKICGKELSNKSTLINHMKAVHPAECKIFYCIICNQRFLRNSSMDAHIRKKHPDGQKQQFECDFDGKIFETKALLNSHMQQHLSLVECSICHKMLKRLCIYKHLRDFHALDRKFQCTTCSKQFKSKESLRIHKKSHNKTFECDICKRMFSLKSQLNEHKKNYHDNAGSYACETCENKFNTKQHLKSHQLTHKKDRLKSFKCQQCDFATDFIGNIKAHQKCHERQDQKFASMKNPIKCEKCTNFYCKNKKALRMHIFKVHSTKERFQCDLCAKLMKTKRGLIYHFTVHLRKSRTRVREEEKNL